MPGLLAINADDFEIDEVTTNAIVECFQASGMTSATGMVHMADSDRAASIVGLAMGSG